MKRSVFSSGYVEVYTFEGPKYIKDLKVGDLVLTHLNRYKQIVDVKRILTPISYSKGIFDIYFFDFENKKVCEFEGIHRIGGGSPIYLNDHCIKKVVNIKEGDILQLRKRKVRVIQLLEIPPENYGDYLYSIEVEKDHSYYADDVLITD